MPESAAQDQSPHDQEGNDQVVSGKKLVPIILIGFVVFAVVMALLTRWMGDMATPYFKSKAAETNSTR